MDVARILNFANRLYKTGGALIPQFLKKYQQNYI